MTKWQGKTNKRWGIPGTGGRPSVPYDAVLSRTFYPVNGGQSKKERKKVWNDFLSTVFFVLDVSIKRQRYRRRQPCHLNDVTRISYHVAQIVDLDVRLSLASQADPFDGSCVRDRFWRHGARVWARVDRTVALLVTFPFEGRARRWRFGGKVGNVTCRNARCREFFLDKAGSASSLVFLWNWVLRRRWRCKWGLVHIG